MSPPDVHGYHVTKARGNLAPGVGGPAHPDLHLSEGGDERPTSSKGPSGTGCPARRSGPRPCRTPSPSGAPRWRGGTVKLHRLVVRVEQHQQRVPDDALARARPAWRWRRRRAGTRASAGEGLSQSSLRISWPSGRNQARSLSSQSQRWRPEEAAALEHGLLVAQLDHARGEVQQRLLRVVERSSPPTTARCPGSRRCCCRAGCGPSRRPPPAWARPGTGRAWRGGCASAARAAR